MAAAGLGVDDRDDPYGGDGLSDAHAAGQVQNDDTPDQDGRNGPDHLSDDAAVREVVAAAQGGLRYSTADTVPCVDCSTLAPELTEA